MKKEEQQTTPHILLSLADLLGTEVINRRLEIPKQFGKGYCDGFVFNKHIRMMISNYELHKDLAIKNPEISTHERMIFFKFQNVFPKTETFSQRGQLQEMPSVLIATSRVNTDDIISIHSNTATINIEVNADYLNEQFDLTEKSPVLQSLLQNTQPLLFEQIIYPSLQEITNEILTESTNKTYELFFLRIKAEELICKLLIELEKRNEQHLYPLNTLDVQTIYKIKERILEHLNIPPVIYELSVYANMSPTKLKRLFRQIFGDSIFSYYQSARMKQAARLLKEGKLSVADVGYQLGFTNLSHFAKVFKEHTGMKPKQYTKSSST